MCILTAFTKCNTCLFYFFKQAFAFATTYTPLYHTEYKVSPVAVKLHFICVILFLLACICVAKHISDPVINNLLFFFLYHKRPSCSIETWRGGLVKCCLPCVHVWFKERFEIVTMLWIYLKVAQNIKKNELWQALSYPRKNPITRK